MVIEPISERLEIFLEYTYLSKHFLPRLIVTITNLLFYYFIYKSNLQFYYLNKIKKLKTSINIES